MFVVNVDGPNIWAIRERYGCIFATSNAYLQILMGAGPGPDLHRSEHSLLASGADLTDSFARTKAREKRNVDPCYFWCTESSHNWILLRDKTQIRARVTGILRSSRTRGVALVSQRRHFHSAPRPSD